MLENASDFSFETPLQSSLVDNSYEVRGTIAVIAVAPTGKASSVYSNVQTRLKS